jgi:hypothetical protein
VLRISLYAENPEKTSNKSVRNFSRPEKMLVANQDNQTKEIFFLVDY